MLNVALVWEGDGISNKANIETSTTSEGIGRIQHTLQHLVKMYAEDFELIAAVFQTHHSRLWGGIKELDEAE
jgi:hypothetical protein